MTNHPFTDNLRAAPEPYRHQRAAGNMLPAWEILKV
jgi:hypothetical protein